MLPHLQSALGIGAIIAIAWALSEDRKVFHWRLVAGTLVAQALIAILLLKVSFVREVLFGLNSVVVALSDATRAGTSFIYGFLGGGPTPFAVTQPANMINLAFGVLPLIIVITSLSAILWYWRILRAIVGVMALLGMFSSFWTEKLGLRFTYVSQLVAWGSMIVSMIFGMVLGSMFWFTVGMLVGAIAMELREGRGVPESLRMGAAAVYSMLGPRGLQLLIAILIIETGAPAMPRLLTLTPMGSGVQDERAIESMPDRPMRLDGDTPPHQAQPARGATGAAP